VPELVVLPSPYRFIVKPLVDRILEMEKEYPDRMIAVVLPELVERHWLHYLLHNQRPELIACFSSALNFFKSAELICFDMSSNSGFR